MRINIYPFILLFSLILLAVSCKDEESIKTMTLSGSSFNVKALDANFKLQIDSETNWTVTSDTDWCTPSLTQGNGATTLTVALVENNTLAERTATLSIKDATTTLTVKVTQAGEEHYKIPVIFHILYKEATDEKQNVKLGWMQKVMTAVNKYYEGNFTADDNNNKKININATFVMATTDPAGKTLTEAGVNRIKTDMGVMSGEKFMEVNDPATVDMLWPYKKYINIFVYTFTEKNILGISHIPYTSSTHQLEGIQPADILFGDTNFSYPHSVSINATYVHDIHQEGQSTNSGIEVTIAHELAHYLGLYHPFGMNNPDEKITWREDTDYCEDTPNYDRESYEEWLYSYLDKTPSSKWDFETMIKRTSITNQTFVSRNIMDYAVSWCDEFTPDQRKRMRHIMHYSPMIPGPKYGTRPSTRAIEEGVMPPKRVIQ